MGGIIWLASYPKSGNTWMRAFLHNLLRNPNAPVPPDRLEDFCLGESKPGWYQPYSDKPTVEMTDAEIMALRPRVHRDMTRVFPDSVFAKTHNMLGEHEGVPLITMDCTVGAIYIVRNPLDVVSSLADHFGLGLDDAIAMMADPAAKTANDPTNVTEVLGSWSTHAGSWTQQQHPGLHVMRYEDMLKKPFATFKGVAKFLGLKPPRARIERAIKFSSFKTLKSLEEKHGFKERSVNAQRFFRSGKAGSWRDVLSPQQVERLVSDHREQMERFGYLPKEFQ